MKYKKAVQHAKSFKLVASHQGNGRTIDLGSSSAWLDISNLLLWSRRNTIDQVDVYAVQPDGDEILCGGWQASEVVATAEGIEAGRLEFLDDPLIKAVVGR